MMEILKEKIRTNVEAAEEIIETAWTDWLITSKEAEELLEYAETI